MNMHLFHQFSLALVSATLVACGGTPFTAVAAVITPDAGDDAPPGDDAGPDAPAADDADADAGTKTDADSAADAADAACTCVEDLSAAGTGDFEIAFDLRTTQDGPAPILNQRAECDAVKPFWAVGTSGQNNVGVEVGDGALYAVAYTTATVNDGAKHHVTVARHATSIDVSVDGTVTETPTTGPADMRNLAALQTGKEAACMMPALVGQISGVCLTIGCTVN